MLVLPRHRSLTDITLHTDLWHLSNPPTWYPRYIKHPAELKNFGIFDVHFGASGRGLTHGVANPCSQLRYLIGS